MLLINWKFMHTFLVILLLKAFTKVIYKTHIKLLLKQIASTIKYIIYYHKLKKNISILSIFTDHNHTSNYSPKHK